MVEKIQTGQGAEKESRHKVLVRQIQSKIELEGQAAQDTSDKAGIMKMLVYASGLEKMTIFLGWFFAAVSGAILPVFFLFIGPAFDAFGTKTPEEARDETRKIGIIMGCLGLGVMFTSFFQNFLLLNTSEKVAAKIKVKYLQAVLNQESAWFDSSTFFSASRIDKDVDLIKNGIGQKFGMILYSLAMFVSGFCVAFYKGWDLALVMLGIAPIMLIGMGCFGAIQEKGTIAATRAYGQSAGYAEQALQAIRIVVSFGQEELEVKNYTRYLKQVTEAGMKQGFASGASMGFFFFCIYVCYAYAFTMGAIWMQEGMHNDTEDRPYKAGDCLAVFFGVLFGLFSLGGAGPAITAVTIAQATGKQAFDIIDRVPAIYQDDMNTEKHTVQGEIEFRNCQFLYPTRLDTKVMDEFNCKFEIGKQTAIVGPSGSGKSTTIQLVERFYDPTKGQVLIDGKDLKTINLRNYRQQIGYVGQEPVLFNTTIKTNILMGKPDATDAEIEDALRKTNSWGFISKYPEGINANVGAGGGQLSGGQKQRIALARAFIKKPRVLIFDEATSALDKVNEAEVQNAIDGMRKELGSVTTLVIAHRLSTIQASDRIIVMKKGRIVEDGNHQSLLTDYPKGVYSKLAQDSAASDEQADKEDDDAAALDIAPQLHPDLAAATAGAGPNKRRQSIAVKQDPISLKQMTKANEELKAYEDEIAENMKAILDPKTSGKAVSERISIWENPKANFYIALILVFCFSVAAPMYGWFIMQTMTELNKADTKKGDFTGAIQGSGEPLKDALLWILLMVGGSFLMLIGKGGSMILLSRISENVIAGIRQNLYASIIYKDIGWHDDRDNSTGVLTSTLSSDVQLVKGLSVEGVGTQVEGAVSLLTGLVLCGIFSWPMLLVGLGITPLILVASAVQGKADQEMMNMKEEEGSDDFKLSEDEKSVKILQADAVQNYKTIASFGNDQILLDEFESITTKVAKNATKPNCTYAISLAISVMIQNATFGLMYLAIGEITYEWPSMDGPTAPDNMFISMFCFMFGAITAGQAAAMGPDAGKALKSGSKIFKIIDTPSKIDVSKSSEQKPVHAESFQGSIELKDVWFRYPSRREQWVFKGLNLKINQKDAIAIVGESGQGKSTFINLVMRFYDPEFGQVLIDGVDVTTLNVVELRSRLGLVMQEPLLFNYSLAENILYGKLESSNEEIYAAAKIANALEFIESKDLASAFSDDPADLKEALLSDTYKEQVIGDPEVGQEKYDELVKKISEIVEKAEKGGKFEAVENLIDSRDAATKGKTQLHQGFDVPAGNRGSKLSGGQKQRIAIARAVVRQPSILLLDEATSALDEESQRLVQEALYEIMANRTSIVVAHRLTTVERCNRLAVIDNGKIVEEGSFTELTTKDNGFFANLANGMRKAEKKENKRLSILAAP